MGYYPRIINNGPTITTATTKQIELPLTEEQLRQIFIHHDTNRDGVLSKEELKTAFKDLGAWFPGFRANGGIRRADGNNDGFIDMDELEALVRYAFKLGYTVK